MTRLLVLVLTIIAIAACDINDSMRAKSSDQAAADIRVLAAKNGCMGCHAVNTTVMGPAWNLVADRYRDLPGARTLLIEAIINGGAGNWTQLTGGKIMPPHQDISHDEVALIVDYILGLGQTTQDTPEKP